MDRLLTDRKVDYREKFVVVRINPVEKMQREINDFLHRQPSINISNEIVDTRVFERNEYKDEFTGMYADLKITPEGKILIITGRFHNPEFPLVNTHMHALPESGDALLYANFQLPGNTKPVRMPLKNEALLKVLGLVTYMMGQALFYLRKTYKFTLIWHITRMGCDPTKQIIGTWLHYPYQTIRVPANCDVHGYYKEEIFPKGRKNDYMADLINSMLMLNSWQK